MKFNINNHVKLKLTPFGVEIYEAQYDKFNTLYPHMKLARPIYSEKCDENGYIEMQLWTVMEMFGVHMYCGGDLPFETEIIIKEE